MYRRIRAHFTANDVLEVETPLLCQHSVTDPYIDSLQSGKRWLQTSPEYAMKRLLAAGYPSIYQICKAFRVDESGQHHNPEFTMLEWYRLDFDHHQLMDDVATLIRSVLNITDVKKMSYQQCWQSLCGIDPLHTTVNELQQYSQQHQLSLDKNSLPDSLDDWLMAIMTLHIEPKLAQLGACFIYDFPASQSALARINANNPSVASRFELYVDGVELANGFHELQDAQQQQQRFEANNQKRSTLHKPTIAIDQYFIDALHHGLPNCSGVALGIDRLLMLMTKQPHIQNVLCYDWIRA